jgi:hypothetical protein
VSESEYARFMTDYFEIAEKTGKIARIYWHQLIAPGYGLVDNRDNTIRKTEAFYRLKNYLEKKGIRK